MARAARQRQTDRSGMTHRWVPAHPDLGRQRSRWRLAWLTSGPSLHPRLGRWTACPYRAGHLSAAGPRAGHRGVGRGSRVGGAGNPADRAGRGRRRDRQDHLVADLERRAGELGFTVATGHGLDLEAGISFAPAVEAMRSLLGAARRPPVAAVGAAHAHPAGPGGTAESGRRSMCWTTSPRPSSKRRPPVRFCWCWRTCTGRTVRPRTSRPRCPGPRVGDCCWC